MLRSYSRLDTKIFIPVKPTALSGSIPRLPLCAENWTLFFTLADFVLLGLFSFISDYFRIISLIQLTSVNCLSLVSFRRFINGICSFGKTRETQRRRRSSTSYATRRNLQMRTSRPVEWSRYLRNPLFFHFKLVYWQIRLEIQKNRFFKLVVESNFGGWA